MANAIVRFPLWKPGGLFAQVQEFYQARIRGAEGKRGAGSMEPGNLPAAATSPAGRGSIPIQTGVSGDVSVLPSSRPPNPFLRRRDWITSRAGSPSCIAYQENPG